MNFFNGFSLHGEEELFKSFIKESDFTICGFSLGAVRAFEHVYNSKKRVDLLQLFSPAFFQDRDERFKRVQTISYQRDKESYIEQFLKNVSYPSGIDLSSYLKFRSSDKDDLKKLLYFTWSRSRLDKLRRRGVEIEVYLGGEDKIIDSKTAYEFFREFATVYFIKSGGHILEEC